MNKVEDISSDEESSSIQNANNFLSDDAMALVAIEKGRRRRRHKKDGDPEDDHSSVASASQTLMSTHVMNMGFYMINLGTERGRKLHMFHLVVLPLIPIIILLIQNIFTYMDNIEVIGGLQDVNQQVINAVDLATLARKLQEERVAVALSFYM